MTDTQLVNRHQNTNTCVFSGNLARDAEVREAGDRQRMWMTLAVSNGPTKKEPTGDTAWVNLTDWSEQRIEGLHRFLVKGKQIAVVCRCNTWKSDKDGETVYNTGFTVQSIELLGSKDDGLGTNDSPSGEVAARVAADDVPF